MTSLSGMLQACASRIQENSVFGEDVKVLLSSWSQIQLEITCNTEVTENALHANRWYFKLHISLITTLMQARIVGVVSKETGAALVGN